MSSSSLSHPHLSDKDSISEQVIPLLPINKCQIADYPFWHQLWSESHEGCNSINKQFSWFFSSLGRSSLVFYTQSLIQLFRLQHHTCQNVYNIVWSFLQKYNTNPSRFAQRLSYIWIFWNTIYIVKMGVDPTQPVFDPGTFCPDP